MYLPGFELNTVIPLWGIHPLFLGQTNRTERSPCKPLSATYLTALYMATSMYKLLWARTSAWLCATHWKHWCVSAATDTWIMQRGAHFCYLSRIHPILSDYRIAIIMYVLSTCRHTALSLPDNGLNRWTNEQNWTSPSKPLSATRSTATHMATSTYKLLQASAWLTCHAVQIEITDVAMLRQTRGLYKRCTFLLSIAFATFWLVGFIIYLDYSLVE